MTTGFFRWPWLFSVLACSLLLVSGLVRASDPASRTFNSEVEEQRYHALITELRCPKCQNQNLAGSDAPIAQDLKQKTFELLQQGRSDGEIRQYMVDRYGNFISYKPPMSGITAGLYLIPPLLLLALVAVWVGWVRNRKSPVQRTALSEAEQKRVADLLERKN